MRNHISTQDQAPAHSGRSQDQLRTRPVVHRQAAEAGDAHAMGHTGAHVCQWRGAWKQATPPRWSGSGRRPRRTRPSALYGLGYMHLSGMGSAPRRQEGFQVLHAGSREQVRLRLRLKQAAAASLADAPGEGECNCLGFAPGSISTLHSGPACVTALARVLKLPSSEACQPQISFCELRLANHSSC